MLSEARVHELSCVPPFILVVAPCADPMDVSRAGVAIAIAPAGSSQDQDQNKLAARGPTPLCMQQPFASLPDAPAPQARPQAFQHIVPLAPATNTFLGKRVPPPGSGSAFR